MRAVCAARRQSKLNRVSQCKKKIPRQKRRTVTEQQTYDMGPGRCGIRGLFVWFYFGGGSSAFSKRSAAAASCGVAHSPYRALR